MSKVYPDMAPCPGCGLEVGYSQHKGYRGHTRMAKQFAPSSPCAHPGEPDGQPVIYCDEGHNLHYVKPHRDDWEGRARIRLECRGCGKSNAKSLEKWEQFTATLINNNVWRVSFAAVLRHW